MTDTAVTDESREVAEARAALLTSPIYDLRDIDIQRDGDSLYLSGKVTTFYHKQLAQEAVRLAAPGFHLHNSVDVEPQQ